MSLDIPLEFEKNFFNLLPNLTKLSPNDFNLSVFSGAVLAICARFLAAFDAAVIFVGSIPSTESENLLRPLPSAGNFFANLATLLSPVNQATIPPSLGIILDISANDLAALAAAVIFSEFISVTASEKPLRPNPNCGISAANLATLFSPVNQATIPPSLGIILVISANGLAALAAAVIFCSFIPVTELEKPLRPNANCGN